MHRATLMFQEPASDLEQHLSTNRHPHSPGQNTRRTTAIDPLPRQRMQVAPTTESLYAQNWFETPFEIVRSLFSTDDSPGRARDNSRIRPRGSLEQLVFVLLLLGVMCMVLILMLVMLSLFEILSRPAFENVGSILSDIPLFRWHIPTKIDISKCTQRVSDTRAGLFTPEIYFLQYNHSTPFTHGHDNTFCAEGFIGDPDLYGIGIRIGLYLQWITSIVANMLFEGTDRNTARTGLLLFACAMVSALFRMSMQSEWCNFGIEIIIMHHLLIGSQLTNILKPYLKFKVEWTGIGWRHIVISLVNIGIESQAAWFWVSGYVEKFPRMPCGTKYFFFGLADEFIISVWRPIFAITFCLLLVVWVVWLALVPTFLAREVFVRSICESHITKGLFPGFRYRPSSLEQMDPEWESSFSRILLDRLGSGTPHLSVGQEISPPKMRRQRIIYAITSLSAYIYCVTAIEVMISANRISGVNSINSVGQYLAMVVAIFTFVGFLYELLKHTVARPPAPHPIEEISDGVEMNEYTDGVEGEIEEADVGESRLDTVILADRDS